MNFQVGDRVRMGNDGQLYTIVPPFFAGDIVDFATRPSDPLAKVRRCFQEGGKWMVDLAFIDGTFTIGDAGDYRRVDVLDTVARLA